jgi:hypothetical protein
MAELPETVTAAMLADLIGVSPRSCTDLAARRTIALAAAPGRRRGDRWTPPEPN